MKIPNKLFGLVFVDANGVRDVDFYVIGDTEVGCVEFALSHDPRGILNAQTSGRYEVVALTEAQVEEIRKEEAEIAEDEAVADYETWSERRMGL